MKKTLKFILPLVALLIITGCGTKSEVAMFTLLNDQIMNQNKCSTNNQQLTNLLAQETDIYNQIIEKGTNSFEDVSGVVEQGKENIEASKEILNDYDVCIQSALVDEAKLSKNIEGIKDEKIKDEAILLTEQYRVYETSLVQYVKSLIKLNDSQGEFYNGINESTSIQTLEELVTTINSTIDEANQASENHREALVKFNELYSTYYDTYIK